MEKGFGKLGLISLALVIALSSMGFSYARWSETLTIEATVQTGTFKCGFTACSSNDPPDTIDPGKDKDVGCCTCQLSDQENGDYEKVIVTIENAYPCYECEVYVTVHNDGTVPATIASVDLTNPSPEAVTVEYTDLVGVGLDPDESVDGTITVHLEQSAAQGATYTFTVEIKLVLWCLGGTQGFWKNWDKHNTYIEEQIEEWLVKIDDASCWLGPRTVEGMEGLFDAGKGSDKENQFLSHYLSLRLDVEAERQYPGSTHDITSISGYGYLALSDPTSAKLSEIIDAIEDKWGTSPTEDQFKIMKNICDALNNLEI